MTFQNTEVGQACAQAQLNMHYETQGHPEIQGQQKEIVLATHLEIKFVNILKRCKVSSDKYIIPVWWVS